MLAFVFLILFSDRVYFLFYQFRLRFPSDSDFGPWVLIGLYLLYHQLFTKVAGNLFIGWFLFKLLLWSTYEKLDTIILLWLDALEGFLIL